MWSRLAVALLVVAVPASAAANVIWPAAILTERSLAWWIVPLSLVIEFFFVWAAFRLTVADAVWTTIGANAASAAVGLFAVPYLGVLFAAVLYTTSVGAAIDWEDFGVADWAVTFFMAVAFNLAIELAVFRYGYRLDVDRRAAWLILAANAITAGLALASLQAVPHPHY